VIKDFKFSTLSLTKSKNKRIKYNNRAPLVSQIKEIKMKQNKILFDLKSHDLKKR
jgi:hypothetical protein